MTRSVKLRELRDEALLKIGRNVVNFQKVESCLKYLIAVSDVQSTGNGLEAHHRKRSAQIQRQPFGQLSAALYQTIYGSGAQASAPADASKVWLSTSFRIEADAATIKQRKRTLSALVAERNKLIHRDLSGFDHNSVPSCRKLINALDGQNVRIIQQLDELATMIETFMEHIAALKAWAEGDGPDSLARHVSSDA